MRTIRNSLSAAVLASVALLAFALPASAATSAALPPCYPPSPSCAGAGITVNPGTVNTGGSFTVTVTDGSFAPGVPYTITLTDVNGTTTFATYTGTTTGAGGIQVTLTLPGSVQPGTYSVHATALDPSQASRTLTGSLTVVTASATTTTPGTTALPRTGASTWPKVWLGGGLVIAGLVAVVLATWRRREPTEA